MRILSAALAAALMTGAAQVALAAEMEMTPTEEALTTAYTYQRCTRMTLSVDQWSAVLGKIASETGSYPSLHEMSHVKVMVARKASGGYCAHSEAMERVEKFKMGMGA